ncbi:major facilitator transporter [Caballeronia calidae]|uniref:Major facilitator transporter n=1 Tax=Caballeronia calidae TaxID=1777139 RepID=A0A158EJW8_9BURK|nr:hypothetical protein [Caballeronia calidae]SAL07201.1 major facilitator transporter [Caballeronia calidae]
MFNGIGNTAGIVTPIVIGYVGARTGSFDRAPRFAGAHGIAGMFAYGLLAGPFKRI